MNLPSSLLLVVLSLALVNCTPQFDDKKSSPEGAPAAPAPAPETAPVVEPATAQPETQPQAEATPQPEVNPAPVKPEANTEPSETTPEVVPAVEPASPTEPSEPALGDAGADKTNDEFAPAAPAPETSRYTESLTTPDPLLSVDLLKLHRKEMQLMSAKQVLEKNEETLAKLYATPVVTPEPNSQGVQRVTAITPEMARELMHSINDHPVVAGYASAKYDQPGTSIGYCFGRATYVHLALLKLGVAKESIRKIWLVGPMYSGSVNWAFHVATVVRTTDGKWMVVDNFPGRVLEVRDWVNNFYPLNQKKGNLRVYITDPSKFSVSLGKYSRVQLGLDLPADQDWYRNYFFDLMDWFQEHSMTELGLPNSLLERPLQAAG